MTIKINETKYGYTVAELLQLRTSDRCAFIGAAGYLCIILETGILCLNNSQFITDPATMLCVQYFVDLEINITREGL